MDEITQRLDDQDTVILSQQRAIEAQHKLIAAMLTHNEIMRNEVAELAEIIKRALSEFEALQSGLMGLATVEPAGYRPVKS